MILAMRRQIVLPILASLTLVDKRMDRLKSSSVQALRGRPRLLVAVLFILLVAALVAWRLGWLTGP